MAHVVAVAGNIERLAALREPRASTGQRIRNGVLRRSRPAPLSFGRVRWAQRMGQLYLMPGFPRGGVLGNHVVFSWREGEHRYALSLHAWEPFTESVAMLEAMVEGLASRHAAERLRRLSPVRRLMMARGRVATRATIAAPPRPSYASEAFVVVPVGADVGLQLETSTGRWVRILASTRGRECRNRPPLRLCLLHFPRLDAVDGRNWTLVASKRSRPPARIRVDVLFR